jgi:acetyl esterase/lipase
MESAEIQKVIEHLDRHRPKERTLATVRAYLEAMVSMEPAPPEVSAEPLVVGGVPAERLTTPGADTTRTLLYLHGGGYALGSPLAYRPFAGRIARAFAGAVVVVDYRLAPEHPFPAGLEDAIAATRALLRTVGPTRLVVGGDSAGGGLALATLISLRDAGEELPAAAALLSPWVDLEGTGDSMQSRAALDPVVTREGMVNLAQMYLGDRSRREPLASPTYAKLERLPPMLVQLGTRELQYDDVMAFTLKLRSAGVAVDVEVWEGMLHVFQMFPVLADSARAIDRIGAYLRSRIS